MHVKKKKSTTTTSVITNKERKLLLGLVTIFHPHSERNQPAYNNIIN
jgi:hypothetical protein